jgi:hypothetical protein
MGCDGDVLESSKSQKDGEESKRQWWSCLPAHRGVIRSEELVQKLLNPECLLSATLLILPVPLFGTRQSYPGRCVLTTTRTYELVVLSEIWIEGVGGCAW